MVAHLSMNALQTSSVNRRTKAYSYSTSPERTMKLTSLLGAVYSLYSSYTTLTLSAAMSTWRARASQHYDPNLGVSILGPYLFSGLDIYCLV